MPFVMDRVLQRKLLERMREAYPGALWEKPQTISLDTLDETHVVGTLVYLEANGLCESGLTSGVDGNWSWSEAKITARGLDFLADDGGLSAILGVVTIKLHAGTIRDLIAAKIEASGLPAEKKSALRAALGKLSGAALQEGSKRLMGLGAEHVGDVEGWLHGLAGLFGQ